MKNYFTRRYLSLAISAGSLVIGLSLMVMYLPTGEGRTDGIGFTIGIFGMPLTLLGMAIMSMVPLSWDSADWLWAILVSLCYFAQWQLIAWIIYPRAVAKKRQDST